MKDEIDCPCGRKALKDPISYRLVELHSENTYTGVVKYICPTCGRLQLFSLGILEKIDAKSINNGERRSTE